MHLFLCFLQWYVIQNRFLHYECKMWIYCCVFYSLEYWIYCYTILWLIWQAWFCFVRTKITQAPLPQIIVLINQSLDQDQCKLQWNIHLKVTVMGMDLSINQSYIYPKFVDGWMPNARSNFKQVITECIFLTYGTTEAKLWPSYNCVIDIYYFTIVSHYIK